MKYNLYFSVSFRQLLYIFRHSLSNQCFTKMPFLQCLAKHSFDSFAQTNALFVRSKNTNFSIIPCDKDKFVKSHKLSFFVILDTDFGPCPAKHCSSLETPQTGMLFPMSQDVKKGGNGSTARHYRLTYPDGFTPLFLSLHFTILKTQNKPALCFG